MTRSQLLKILKVEKPKLQSDFNLDKIGLFGSFSINRQHAGSDIDLLYTMKQGHYLKFDDKLNLEKYLKLKLNRKIDLVPVKYMHPAVQLKAKADVIYV